MEGPIASVASELLKALPLCAMLDEDRLRHIAAISRRTKIRYDEVLFDLGERPGCLYALLAGRVALGTRGRTNRFLAIEILRVGELVGIAPVLLNSPALMEARVLEDGEAICISATALREMLLSDPQLAMSMLASLASSHRSMVRQIHDLKSRSVAQRLSCYLLSLAEEQGRNAINLPLEKRLLASRLGATPESLSRAFSELRSCGVQTSGRVVYLGNVKVLAKFARPDQIG